MKIWPKPGVTGDALLRALEHVANTAQNALHGDGDQRKEIDLYLKWADSAAQHIASTAAADDIDRLILNQTYWATYQNSEYTQPRLAKVRAEVQSRIVVLSQTVEDTKAMIRRWGKSSREERIVVVDTNIYLQHEAEIEDMPWFDLLTDEDSTSYDLRIVIPAAVVDELDNGKRHQVRARARTTTRTLWQWLGSDQSRRITERIPDGHGSVTIELLPDNPGHVRLDIWDDEIVARALAIQDVRGEQIDFVTFDAGAAFRAGAAGLRTHHLLEPEKSADQRGKADQRNRARLTNEPPSDAVRSAAERS